MIACDPGHGWLLVECDDRLSAECLEGRLSSGANED